VSRTLKDWRKDEKEDRDSRKKPKMEPYKREKVDLNNALSADDDDDEDFSLFPDEDEEEDDESDLDSGDSGSN